MKICSACRQLLDDSQFYPNRQAKSNLSSKCRECEKARARGYPGPVKPRSQARTTYLAKKVNGVHMQAHRVVMEAVIGRPLTPFEYVHHINGDKHDNRPENLQIMSISEHSIFHATGHVFSQESRKKMSDSHKHIPHKRDSKGRFTTD